MTEAEDIRTEFEELQTIVGQLSERLQDLKMWVVRELGEGKE